MRLVPRYRRKPTHMHSAEINRLHKVLDDDGIKLGGLVSDIGGVSATAMVKGLIQGQDIASLLDLARGALKLKRDDLQAALEGDLSARHLFVLRHIHAHTLWLQCELAEIGDDMARFGCAERLASWAALCPGNNESAGKRKSSRTRHGNAVIGYILCECANAARWTKSTLAAKYRSLMVHKSHKKAIVALAHKMIRLIYVLLTRKQAYLDPHIDYAAMSAKKNAPR